MAATESVSRLNCRIDASIKSRAEEAAAILGQSITAFTESALSEKAHEVLSRIETIQLSARDFDRFVNAINRPARPTAKLRKAAEEYRKIRERNPESNW